MDDRPVNPPGDGESDVPDALVADIAARLHGPCAHLAPETFAALVLSIARTKVRFARRAASLPGLSGVWDPPEPLPLEALRSQDG